MNFRLMASPQVHSDPTKFLNCLLDTKYKSPIHTTQTKMLKNRFLLKQGAFYK